MDPRLLRALVSEDPRAPVTPPHPDHAAVVAHFRAVIYDAWTRPSEDHRLAKRQLDYFCGHIDAMPALRDFVPVSVVVAHYTALNGHALNEGVSFTRALAMYLSLLNIDMRSASCGDEFRGASVTLTFDSARHERNILRFAEDRPVLGKTLRPSRTPSR